MMKKCAFNRHFDDRTFIEIKTLKVKCFNIFRMEHDLCVDEVSSK